jgi:hypothetical protein
MTTSSQTELPPVLVAIYDLREPDQWRMVCRHTSWWGSKYVRADHLFADRIALAFRPSPDRRWLVWEAHRLSQIFGELWPERLQAGEAA